MPFCPFSCRKECRGNNLASTHTGLPVPAAAALSCPAEQDSGSSESYLNRLGILSQRGPALNHIPYTYRGCHFWQKGCLPASMSTAVLAAFVVAGLNSTALLLAVMMQTAPEHRPDLYPIVPVAVSRLLCADTPDGCPGLLQVTDAMSAIVPVDQRLSGTELARQPTALGDTRAALVFTLNIRSYWRRVPEITNAPWA